MSKFAVKIYPLKISRHPNADLLELAQVGDYLSVVNKGQFRTGDLGAYIPEGAIVPQTILQKLNLVDKLAGREKNRVKALKLRGILSQGIVYPVRQKENEYWLEVPAQVGNETLFIPLMVSIGSDVTEDLKIVKYEPPIPTELSGQVYNVGTDKCLKFDIENIKAFPDVLVEGEPVVFTEKLHGSFAQFGYIPTEDIVVSSKGLGAKGLAFKLSQENVHNLYVRTAKAYDIKFAIEVAFGTTQPVFVLGEIFGKGIQDLGYGENTAKNRIGFRVFDVYVGSPDSGRYLNDAELDIACAAMNLLRVPVLYRGAYSKTVMLTYTSGKETVSGQAMHIREGIVVRPIQERQHTEIGRCILKSVSEEYLLRKGGTEFN